MSRHENSWRTQASTQSPISLGSMSNERATVRISACQSPNPGGNAVHLQIYQGDQPQDEQDVP